MAESELVEVFAAANVHEATQVQAIIEEAGIKTKLLGEQLGDMGGALPFGHDISPRIVVRRADAEQAIALIVQWEPVLDTNQLPKDQMSDEPEDAPIGEGQVERTSVNWRAVVVALLLLSIPITFLVWREFFAEPTTPAAFYKRASRRYVRGEYELAIKDYSAMLFINHHDWYAHASRGNAYLVLGHFDRAIADYSDALVTHEDAPLFYNRGTCWEAKLEYELALGDYESAIDLNNLDPEAHNAIAWLFATCPQAAFRDGTRAVEHAKTAVELTLSPEWYHLDTLAAAHAEAGDYEEAAKLQRAVIKKAPLAEAEECRAALGLYLARKPRRDQ